MADGGVAMPTSLVPRVVERGRASVVAITSTPGLIEGFDQSAYEPAKFAVGGPGAVTRALHPAALHRRHHEQDGGGAFPTELAPK
ncbi:hypothetical protein TN53_36525 [Streptomyces sp. WM6386]|nr:hypothetical protein TN53_36525 [Streptomyces sp. WM6386]